MLENLIFSLDRVMPYFLLIILGAVFRKSGLVPRSFFEGANRFTFKIALPFQLFCNIVSIDWGRAQKGSFMLHVLVVTIVSFAVIWLVTELIYKDKALIGTLVQGAFRGNFVLLGVQLASSVLGPSAVQTASLASVVVIPAYNILSVIILTIRGKSQIQQTFSGVMRSIVTNPLIIGICLALPLMLLKIKMPAMIERTMTYVGQTGTPLGLLSIGGMLSLSSMTHRLKPAIYASSIKNLLLPAAVMPVSFFMGYRGDELLVMLVLSAAPVAISSYAMASEMGGDAPLASNILILSTFFSGFVLAAGIYILKMSALI